MNKIKNIFECFSKTKKKGNTIFEREATNLGLSSAKALVEALGGFIFVETGTNVGTQITFGVPIETTSRSFFLPSHMNRNIDQNFILESKDYSEQISTNYTGEIKKYNGKKIKR